MQRRWEYEDVTGILHQRGKARDAERHQEQAKDLPAVQFRSALAGTARADHERHSDDRAQAERSEPESRPQIEVVPYVDTVPDRVTPQDRSACV